MLISLTEYSDFLSLTQKLGRRFGLWYFVGGSSVDIWAALDNGVWVHCNIPPPLPSSFSTDYPDAVVTSGQLAFQT
jgi:hypothetical protein